MKNLSSKKIITILLFFALISVTEVYSQRSDFNKSWRLGVGGGPNLFCGDMETYRFIPAFNDKYEWKFGGDLSLEYKLTPVFGLRGQFLYAGLSGARLNWSRYFESDIMEFNLAAILNLNSLFAGYNSDRRFNVNLILGVGLTNYNTTIYEIDSDNILEKRGFGNGKGIGGRTLEGVMVGGLGFDYSINDNWLIRLETSFHPIGDDMLDKHVGGVKYDMYHYTELGIVYSFGKSKRSRSYSDVPETYEPVDKKPVVEKPTEQEKVEEEYKPLNRVVDVNEPVAPEPVVEKQEPVVERPTVWQPGSNDTEYRVQIRARYKQKISINYLSENYNIPASEITESTNSNYYIYTVGSFKTYDEALAYRNIIRSQHKVYDAFIVAFRNGTRLQKLP